MTRIGMKTIGTALAAAGLAVFLAGCKPADFGPKSADYKAAHTAHYHPGVQRREAGAATTRPEAGTAAADFRFGGGPAGLPILFVNGESITIPEVLEPLYDDLAIRAKSLSEASYRDYLLHHVADQINTEISRVIIFQEAKRTFPDKADEAFAKEADNIVTEIIDNRFGGVRARYEEHLKAVGLSSPEMKERIKRQLMVSQYLHEHFKAMLRNPTRAELLKYYREHAAEFTTPPRGEMFVIEIPLEVKLKRELASATAEQVAAARKEALADIRRAREELASGVEFADVARQYSPESRPKRGGAVAQSARAP